MKCDYEFFISSKVVLILFKLNSICSSERVCRRMIARLWKSSEIFAIPPGIKWEVELQSLITWLSKQRKQVIIPLWLVEYLTLADNGNQVLLQQLDEHQKLLYKAEEKIKKLNEELTLLRSNMGTSGRIGTDTDTDTVTDTNTDRDTGTGTVNALNHEVYYNTLNNSMLAGTGIVESGEGQSFNQLNNNGTEHPSVVGTVERKKVDRIGNLESTACFNNSRTTMELSNNCYDKEGMEYRNIMSLCLDEQESNQKFMELYGCNREEFFERIRLFNENIVKSFDWTIE